MDMKQAKLKNTMKNERGSITIFVLTSMLFFLVILLSIYMNNVNKNSNMNKDIKRIEEQYIVTTDDLEKAYQNVVNEIKYPEPLLDSKNIDDSDILKKSDGTYRYFDGTDDQEFPILSESPTNGGVNFEGYNALTVSTTIKTDFSDLKTSGDYHIVGNIEAAGWQLQIDKDKKINFSINNSKGETEYSIISSDTELEDSTIYNIICIFVRGKGYMYIDGEAKHENVDFSPVLDSSFVLNSDTNIPTMIGANPKTTGIDANTGFKGNIYDVKVWGEALTEDEINYLVNEQNGLYGNQ